MSSKIHLVQVPLGSGSLGRAAGAVHAPEKIIAAANDFFLTERGSVPRYNFETTQTIPLHQSDYGAALATIEQSASQLFLDNVLTIFLGGDHSITYPLVKSFAKSQEGKATGLLIFDAHLDAENDFIPPTHEDIVQAIVNQGLIAPENILLVGVRNWHENEKQFIEEKNIASISMREIASHGIIEIAKRLVAFVERFDALYLSLDIDVLDPAFAPGTGYAEPGGLTTRELLSLLQSLHHPLVKGKIKAVDMVEVNPEKDVAQLTVTAAAKLLVELSDVL
ncbi:MAG: arginase family protein [Candidatus Woesearchaeota archaeon]|nr:MAG: arginase family protein [Candidatus Woesearchaeota archaeon]